MGPILFRIVVLAIGLAVGETGVTSLFSGDPAWVPQLGIALVALVVGSLGFMGQLIAGRRKELRSDG
jgi:hypothetical protein